MLRKQRMAASASAAALVFMGFIPVAHAAEVMPPEAATAAAPKEITLDAKALDQDIGVYKFSDLAVMTVSRTGTQLSAQATGQPAVPIYPTSKTDFFFKVADAQLTFVQDGTGHASAVILHQNGADVVMPRVDPAAAQRISAWIDQRVKAQTPAPGAEAALRGLIDEVMAGKPSDDRMTPAFAHASRSLMARLQPVLSGLGAVQSVQFVGVNASGQDAYDVTQANGSTHWFIALDEQGKIAAALVTPG